jgi:hypothetical protein
VLITFIIIHLNHHNPSFTSTTTTHDVPLSNPLSSSHVQRHFEEKKFGKGWSTARYRLRASIGMGGHLKPHVGQRCPRPFTRAYRVSPFIVAYILITHLCRTGIHHAAFKTGLYDAKQIVPQVKIAIFDGNDVKFAVLTVYTEIDEYELVTTLTSLTQVATKGKDLRARRE